MSFTWRLWPRTRTRRLALRTFWEFLWTTLTRWSTCRALTSSTSTTRQGPLRPESAGSSSEKWLPGRLKGKPQRLTRLRCLRANLWSNSLNHSTTYLSSWTSKKMRSTTTWVRSRCNRSNRRKRLIQMSRCRRKRANSLKWWFQRIT